MSSWKSEFIKNIIKPPIILGTDLIDDSITGLENCGYRVLNIKFILYRKNGNIKIVNINGVINVHFDKHCNVEYMYVFGTRLEGFKDFPGLLNC